MTPTEKIISRSIRLTWVFYLFGALYVVGPVLGWILGGLAALSLYLGPAIRSDLHATGSIPPVIWAWIVGMFAMLVVLWIGHLDWQLGLKQTVKSSIGWAKGWALMFLFPLAGAVLPVRREPIVRAYCVLAAITLIALPVFLVAPYVGLPGTIFTSPLKVIGGPGPEYFTVYLYTLDPGTWAPRWQFFLPWSPFAGLIGVLTVLFAREEADRRWKWIGYVAGIAMILMSKSRMSLVALPICLIAPVMLPLIARSWAWATAAAIASAFSIVGASLLQAGQDAVAAFRSARADSTRVRETLQRIAEERWWTEAPLFGHGVVERGPHLVEYMPIGSHHTWFGLLFVKGIFGLLALAIPMIWQLGIALLDAARGRRGRLPLGIMLTFAILSLGENIEIEVYMLWPALVILGIHAREVRLS